MRYFIELSYNGKRYHGWQKQPNAISVQEVLEDGLSKLLKIQTTIFGAGRTDSGVHAEQMFAHFDYHIPLDFEVLIFKLNSFLPNDISIKNKSALEIHKFKKRFFFGFFPTSCLLLIGY